MPDPLDRGHAEIAATLDLIAGAAGRYLAELDQSPVLPAGADAAAETFGGPLPEDGDGALAALAELLERGIPAATRSSGPRFLHFVTGGVTPAALGADWLASTLDQNSFSWVGSPLGSRLEAVSIAWLRELFELPPTMAGVLTTGATMANFTALAAARHWAGERVGIDIEEAGLAAVPPIRIVSSGFIHSSAVKAVAMLGLGRSSIQRFPADAVGTLDLEALARALRDEPDRPTIIVANAGEVNAGAFDPIEAMADLAERHGAWLHVDGAFGLFARLTPLAAGLAAGIERADSVIADGHKWLNVPYDCGFAFVRDPMLLPRTFTASAAYLPSPDDPRPQFGYFGPEMSRRARALAVWATLRAYGRAGHRAMVERHLGLARRLAERIDAAPELERLAEVPLNIVCFRLRPPGVPEEELDGLNARLGDALLADGRIYAGTTTYGGVTALRPAIVNWRTTARDVDLFLEIVQDLGAQLAREASAAR
jgi:glutamate/tyrosine decarboxylase-like PLP-dependent enzyme